MTDLWLYRKGDEDPQKVEVLSWQDGHAVVIAREMGSLPRHQPSLVRLSDLRELPDQRSAAVPVR